MNLDNIQLGDLVFVKLRVQPTQSFHAKVEALPTPKASRKMVTVRRELNQIMGRLANNTRAVFPDEIVEVRRRRNAEGFMVPYREGR